MTFFNIVLGRKYGEDLSSFTLQQQIPATTNKQTQHTELHNYIKEVPPNHPPSSSFAPPQQQTLRSNMKTPTQVHTFTQNYPHYPQQAQQQTQQQATDFSQPSLSPPGYLITDGGLLVFILTYAEHLHTFHSILPNQDRQ